MIRFMHFSPRFMNGQIVNYSHFTNTKIIFDTIRADYFKNIFKNIKIIRSDIDTVHKSKRLICSEFLN